MDVRQHNQRFRSFEEFTAAAVPFVQQCDAFISKHRLNGSVAVDHLCFKCTTAAVYEDMRAMLEGDGVGAYVYQVQLSGRRVAYVGLQNGIVSGNNTIKFIELSDKKPTTEENVGFHHAEIYPTNLAYADLIKMLEDAGEAIQHQFRPHHSTHDLVLPSGFILRFTERPLIKKIVQEQLSLIR